MKKGIHFSRIFILFLIALMIAAFIKFSPYSVQQNHRPEVTAILSESRLKIPVTAGQRQNGNQERAYLPLIAKSNQGPGIDPSAQNYFVASNGNDANPGTLERPWRTIQKAARSVSPGVNVYVHGGVYREQVNLTQSGADGKPIRFLAYPGETPVLEGENLSIRSWSALLTIAGDYIQVDGFEVRNSQYMGVVLKGRHDQANNLYAHHNQENGILLMGDYGAVTNSRIWSNSFSNQNGKASSWSSGLSAARDDVDGVTDFATFQNNTIWENWGEGLSVYEANQVVMEGNVSHDNYSANIYISDSTNVICNRNFVYMNPASPVMGHGANVGIMLGDERYTPASNSIQVINNIAYGNNRNFFWWQGDQGGGMKNVLIANNTFVNSVANSNVIIAAGEHQNVQFINNIVQQDGGLPAISTVSNPNVSYAHNLWSKTPDRAVTGVDNRVADPGLIKSGQAFSPLWFSLSSSSPAINAAVSLSQVSTDYFGKSRGASPDLGSVEYAPPD